MKPVHKTDSSEQHKLKLQAVGSRKEKTPAFHKKPNLCYSP